MRSSLILTDADGRIQHFWLPDNQAVIGRDPDCDVPVASSHASWSHASVQMVDGRHVIVDLGSTNGTTVNGVSATQPMLLRSGDRIVIAEEIEFKYQAGQSRWAGLASRSSIFATVAIASIAGLIAIGISVFLLSPRADPELAAAISLAEQGIEAARAGHQIEARDALRAAAGQLYTAGYLDDVARGDLQREAMRLLQSQLDVSFDLWSFYDAVLRHASEPRVVSPTIDHRFERCRLEGIESSLLEPCLQFWIEHVLLSIRQDTKSIPSDFHRSVGRRLRIENEFLRKALIRGESLVPMLKSELERAKMPPLLHYVALIESGYKNAATSSAAAAGIWQFMPATGRQYGLRVDGQVDERRSPEKATRAAAQYLRDLAFEFGGDALLLALAGYNRGENGVRRSLKKLDDPFSDRSYWRLVERDLLPDETQNYVPRFIAAAVAGEGGLPSVRVLREAGY